MWFNGKMHKIYNVYYRMYYLVYPLAVKLFKLLITVCWKGNGKSPDTISLQHVQSTHTQSLASRSQQCNFSSLYICCSFAVNSSVGYLYVSTCLECSEHEHKAEAQDHYVWQSFPLRCHDAQFKIPRLIEYRRCRLQASHLVCKEMSTQANN